MQHAKHSDLDIDQHGERITALEEGLGGIRNSITDLVATVRESRITRENEVRELSAQITRMGRANYPLYIAAITLTITLVAAVLYPFVTNIRELKDEDKTLTARVAHLETEEAVTAERVASLRRIAEEKKP